MCDAIKSFGQQEYTRVLNNHRVGAKRFSQTVCEKILIEHGVSYHQAKDGAYVYLHHGGFNPATSRTAQSEYERILNEFGAPRKTYIECVEHLKELGFTYGQAKTAVHKYRERRHLIGR
jgi:hypothetical protein